MKNHFIHLQGFFFLFSKRLSLIKKNKKQKNSTLNKSWTKFKPKQVFPLLKYPFWGETNSKNPKQVREGYKTYLFFAKTWSYSDPYCVTRLIVEKRAFSRVFWLHLCTVPYLSALGKEQTKLKTNGWIQMVIK